MTIALTRLAASSLMLTAAFTASLGQFERALVCAVLSATCALLALGSINEQRRWKREAPEHG